MELSRKQWGTMERLRGGVDFWGLGEDERERVRYLESLGLAGAREDHGPGRWELTEEGERELDIFQQQIQEKEQRERDQIRIAEAAANQAAEDRASEHRFQIQLTFLQAALSFGFGLVSGAILANLDRIIPWVLHGFSSFVNIKFLKMYFTTSKVII